jgi:hypothetical protein
MSNKIVQKMACGEYVFLTPDHKYVFKGRVFTRLSEAYNYELKNCVNNSTKKNCRDEWIREMIKRSKGL